MTLLLLTANWALLVILWAWYLYHYRAPSILQIEAYVTSRAIRCESYHDAGYYTLSNGDMVLVPRETTFLKADVHLRLAAVQMLAKAEGEGLYKTRRAIWQHAKENGL